MCLPVFAGVGLAMGASAASAAATGTMAVGMTAATVAAGGMAAYGAYQQGQSGKKMYGYQASVAQQQQDLINQTAERNISSVQEGAKFETKTKQREVAQVEGMQKATLAAQGVGGGSVTAADIAKSTFDTAKLDEIAIRYNADSKAWGIQNNAMYQTWDLESQRKGYLMAGKNAARAGNINAASSLLSTASQVGGIYLKYKGY